MDWFSLDTTSKDMMQAVLEGIAFRAAEVIDAMQIQTKVADKFQLMVVFQLIPISVNF